MVVVASTIFAQAQDKGNKLLEFLDPGKELDAQFIQVQPDPSMEQYAKIIAAAKKKDPEWFSEHEKKGKAGTPLKFDEKLMTKEQYEGYLASWAKRKIVAMKDRNGMPIKLKVELVKEDEGEYVFYVSGGMVPLSTMTYKVKSNSWSSMLGELKELEPIAAPEDSSLGAWKGYEWKSEKKDGRTMTKQNIAIGRSADKKFGYLIFRFQQLSGDSLISNKSYFMRFFPVKKEKK